MPEQDVEVTLGTGKLLGLFFGMVVVCAIFFGLGYSMGKNATPAGSLITDGGPSVVQAGPKPTPARTPPTAASTDAGAPPTAPSQADLTFYKSTEQKEVAAKLTPAAEAKAPPSAAPATPAAAPKQAPAPEMHSGAGYVVQVAAVAKQEDAEALADALRKKSYPVFVMNTANDKLIRVQIGPFAELRQAEDMKAKLAGDGYNAIVKK
ncbi:MAG TPA: SPOR domain-containing protein [Terriglobales bacterium]|nr:SPOR domain-containing protein [Terriglobales bacterium]